MGGGGALPPGGRGLGVGGGKCLRGELVKVMVGVRSLYPHCLSLAPTDSAQDDLRPGGVAEDWQITGPMVSLTPLHRFFLRGLLQPQKALGQ